MNTSKKIYPLNFITLIFSLFFSRWLYMSFLFPYSRYISRYGLTFETMLNTVIILILSYFSFVLLHFIYTRKISKTTIESIYVLYILSLIYVLFFKNIGVQGISLNPLSFIDDMIKGSHFVPIMNLLMFIPLGFLYPANRRNLFIALLGLLAVESSQYIFHLGIFDLGDVVLNFSSLLIGNFFAKSKVMAAIKEKIA